MTRSSEPFPTTRIESRLSQRLPLLDLARGIAVVAMVIYHFSWDLSWFAFVDWQVAEDEGWRTFAISIAASFLFLAGISLDLAHHNKIRWRSFWKREAIIVAAAVCVSIGTYLAFSESFVRFGILHCIAVSSLIALPFIRLPLIFSIVVGCIFLALPGLVSHPFFDCDLLLWTGLGEPASASVDYVPLAPWTGATLLGVAASKSSRKAGLNERISAFQFDDFLGHALRWLGRHSLSIYLLHQPALYGLVWSATLLGLGPDMDRVSLGFQENCAITCTQNMGDRNRCEAACSCTLSNLKTSALWSPLLADPENPTLQSQMNEIYKLCLADPEYLKP